MDNLNRFFCCLTTPFLLLGTFQLSGQLLGPPQQPNSNPLTFVLSSKLAPTFQKTYGDSLDQVGNYVIEVTDPVGGYLVAGYTSSYNISGAVNLDAYLLRVDNFGNVLWQKKYGGEEDEFFTIVTRANDNDGFIAIGTTESYGQQKQVFIVKTDNAGNVQMTRTFGNDGNDRGVGLLNVPGGYVISGTTDMPFPALPAHVRPFALHLDDAGALVWSRVYVGGNQSVEEEYLVNYLENGVLYASGSADNAGTLVRIDLISGSLMPGPIQLYDGANSEALFYLRPTIDSNLILADHTSSAGPGMRQWVCKIGKGGGPPIWSNVYSDPDTSLNLRGRIENVSDGGFLLTPRDSVYAATNEPILIKIDPAGNVLWSYKYGGPDADRFFRAQETLDGGFIAVGHTRSTGAGQDDIFLVKTNQEGLVDSCCRQIYEVNVEPFQMAVLQQNRDAITAPQPSDHDTISIPAALVSDDYCPNPQPVTTTVLMLCPGDSIVLDSIAYTAPDTVSITLPGIPPGCDTLVTYILIPASQVSIDTTIALCSGDSIVLDSIAYTAPDTVTITLPGIPPACDTLVTYNLVPASLVSIDTTIALCSGDSILLDSIFYTAPDTVTITLPGIPPACDTLVTYILVPALPVSIDTTIALCSGDSILIDSIFYTAPDTVTVTLPGIPPACDTLVTYVLVPASPVSIDTTIALCSGDSILIDSTFYTAPDTVTITLPGIPPACDTLVTYHLVSATLVSIDTTVALCPGDSIVIGGISYTAPDTVTITLPGIPPACDTLVTYHLVPAPPQTLNLSCPPDVTVNVAAGVDSVVVNYPAPAATGTCPSGAGTPTLLSGLASGSMFPVGVTEVCYVVEDECCNVDTCCFDVTVAPPDVEPCDEATINCIFYELLEITKDAAGNQTYRFRVTNNCTNKLIYAAFQVPSGITADEPPNNSVYTAPSGREYDVRNPNFSPIYSVRFKSTTDSISNGESDIFEYTLPPQASQGCLLAIVRVYPKIFHQAHLCCTMSNNVNVFQTIPDMLKSGNQIADGSKNDNDNKDLNDNEVLPAQFEVFPNPTEGTLLADFSGWQGEQLQVQVFNSQGQQVQLLTLQAGDMPQPVQLPEGLHDGLYFIEVLRQNGEKQTLRFVIQR